MTTPDRSKMTQEELDAWDAALQYLANTADKPTPTAIPKEMRWIPRHARGGHAQSSQRKASFKGDWLVYMMERARRG